MLSSSPLDNRRNLHNHPKPYALRPVSHVLVVSVVISIWARAHLGNFRIVGNTYVSGGVILDMRVRLSVLDVRIVGIRRKSSCA